MLKILNEHFNPTSEEYGKYDINIRQKTDIQRGDGTVTRDTTATTPTKSTQPRQEPTEPTQDTATYASRVLRARDVYRKYYFPVETPEPTES